MSSPAEVSPPPPSFRPLAVGALYTGIERGLSADVLAARALDGQAFPICTTLVSASHGTVTDVLDVPTDSVDAQLEHLFATTTPNAARLGIMGHHKTIDVVFDQIDANLDGPAVLDLTLSGPSGEDLIGQRGTEALTAHLSAPDLVTLRSVDAQLLAGMELTSLDDAQVAVQRLCKQGAARVLLRCGSLPARSAQTGNNRSPDTMHVDLYYDGEAFSLFEAPHLDADELHGSSSALSMSILRELAQDTPIVESLQAAKAFTTEALRFSLEQAKGPAPYYFWNLIENKNPS